MPSAFANGLRDIIITTTSNVREMIGESESAMRTNVLNLLKSLAVFLLLGLPYVSEAKDRSHNLVLEARLLGVGEYQGEREPFEGQPASAAASASFRAHCQKASLQPKGGLDFPDPDAWVLPPLD